MSYHRLAGASGAASSPTDVLRAPLAVRRSAVSQNRNKVAAQLQQLGLEDKVAVNVDGSLQLKNILADLDRAVGQMLRQPLPDFGVDPISGRATDKGKKVGTTLVDSLPFSASQKAAMKNNPVSFMLGIFTPLVNVFGEALTEVMDKGLTAAERQQKTAKDKGLGKGGYVYDLSSFPTFLGSKGRAVNIALVQAGDDMFDAASQQQIKLIRTVVAFCVLFFKKWIELHAALVRKGVKLLFGEDIVVTQRTDRANVTTPSTAEPVDALPRNAVGPISARSSDARNALQPTVDEVQRNAVVWHINEGTAQAPKHRFFKLSARGLFDRKTALQADWDKKYRLYEADFHAFHPDYALRALVAGRTKVAEEFGLKRRFATERQLSKFQVTAGAALGGGTGSNVNGARPVVSGGRPAPLGGFYAVERGTMGNYTSGLGAADGGVVEGAAAEATTLVLGVPVANSLILSVVLGVLSATGLVVLGVTGLMLGFNVKVNFQTGEIDITKASPASAPPLPQAPPPQLDTQSAPPAAPPAAPPVNPAPQDRPAAGEGVSPVVLLGGAVALGGLFLLLRRR